MGGYVSPPVLWCVPYCHLLSAKNWQSRVSRFIPTRFAPLLSHAYTSFYKPPLCNAVSNHKCCAVQLDVVQHQGHHTSLECMRFHGGWGVAATDKESISAMCPVHSTYSRCMFPVRVLAAELPLLQPMAVDPLSWHPSVCRTCLSDVMSAVYLCIDHILCSLAVNPVSVCVCIIVPHSFVHSVPGTPSYEQSFCNIL